MIEPAIQTKLNVKSVVGFLVHSEFWEGPCRAGKKEEMLPEVEYKDAETQFEKMKQELKQLIPQVNVLEPVFIPYYESFVVEEKYYKKIEEDIAETDILLNMSWRIPKIERFRKPVVVLSNGVEGVDVSAYCRSIGLEAYNAVNYDDLNELLHLLWVRKAVSKTRALVLAAGPLPTFGLLSNIRDCEELRNKYGIEIVKQPYTDIFRYMDEVKDKEADEIRQKLLKNSQRTKVNTDYLLNDIKYYLAAKRIMEDYGCNAFSTACHELCTSKIPQQRKFVPCITHTLLKSEGIPSACEEDLNALMAMTIMMYAANRPAFMGNPFYETDEVLMLHHAVPGLCMNGFGTPNLPYEIWSFTGQGFGGKIQIDFAGNDKNEVTLGRFNPQGNKMVVTKGEAIRSEYKAVYCSPHYYIKLDDVKNFMHTLADFGHHQCLIFGDHTKLLEKISKVMDFEIVKG
jgi:L-fucose isomerase-like protein